MTRWQSLVALGAAALALAACGGDDGEQALADRPADEVLQASAAALEQVESYHVEADQTTAQGTSRIVADVTAQGRALMRVRAAGVEAEIRVADAGTFLRANRSFWRTQARANAQLAETVSDKWVVAPGDDIAKGLEELRPATLAFCLRRSLGEVTKQGVDEVDGAKVVVLASDGKAPGTTPGTLAVAAEGEPLPVRFVQTGRERPGGTKDPRCDDEGETTSASDVRFSAYGEPVEVQAPPDPLDLSGAGAGTGAQSD